MIYTAINSIRLPKNSTFEYTLISYLLENLVSGFICRKPDENIMLHSMYINVLAALEISVTITIETNSICHRRTKGTYPDYNCSDDKASFRIALFLIFPRVITKMLFTTYKPHMLLIYSVFCKPYYTLLLAEIEIYLHSF